MTIWHNQFVRIKPENFLKIFLFFFFIASYFYLLIFYLNYNINISAPITNNSEPITSVVSKSTEKVIRVIDGDTFEIEGGIKVRLIGVDTPEMKNKNKTIDCFAQEAKQKMEKLLTNQEVVLEKDVSETDRYGRLLRYVYLGDEMINDILVRDGYAKIATFPPDVKFKDQFLTSEREARKFKVGLWSACK